MRFSFNTTEEHSPGFKTAQQTHCRTSQERRHHHARIGSWNSHPVRPCVTSRAATASHVVFMLLPALVLTRRRRCPRCLIWDPFAPLKNQSRFVISQSSPEDTRCIVYSGALCDKHQNRRTPTTLYRAGHGPPGLLRSGRSQEAHDQTSRCQNRWIVPFQLHPHPGNHQRMDTT